MFTLIFIIYRFDFIPLNQFYCVICSGFYFFNQDKGIGRAMAGAISQEQFQSTFSGLISAKKENNIKLKRKKGNSLEIVSIQRVEFEREDRRNLRGQNTEAQLYLGVFLWLCSGNVNVLDLEYQKNFIRVSDYYSQVRYHSWYLNWCLFIQVQFTCRFNC